MCIRDRLIGELVKVLSVFDGFLYANDYHNLKAAIKEARMDSEYPGIYIDQGTDVYKRQVPGGVRSSGLHVIAS